MKFFMHISTKIYYYIIIIYYISCIFLNKISKLKFICVCEANVVLLIYSNMPTYFDCYISIIIFIVTKYDMAYYKIV